MALAALIMATEAAADDREGLRATLPLVGRTLVEHQARQAARAGAQHLVILVERMPPALIAAIDRLRKDGLRVEIARTVGDAADRFHPDESLLLFADGAIVEEAIAMRIAEAAPPTLGTVPDVPGREGFERIDGVSRWAGIALIDGATMRETAAMLGQWDLQSTLLRRAVQGNARRTDAAGMSDAAALPRIVRGASDLDGIDRWLLSTSSGGRGSWPERFLFAPLATLAVAGLVKRPIDALWVAAAAGAAALIGGLLLVAGLLWPGLVLLLLSGPVAGIAARLAKTRLATIRHGAVWRALRSAGGAIGLIGLALIAGRGVEWGWLVIALTTIAAMLSLGQIRRIKARLGEAGRPLWLADLDGLIWLMLPFAAFGRVDAGLIALAGYAAGSFGWALARAVRLAEGRSGRAV